MELKTVIIDSAERIFLDGEELQNVTAYKLKHSADSEGPAELSVKLLLNQRRNDSGSNILDSRKRLRSYCMCNFFGFSPVVI